MKKNLKLILSLGCLTFLCAGMAACAEETTVDSYFNQGYKITVTYDANGGSFLNRPGVTVMDMFKPADYQAGSDGKIHIKLTEPTSQSRPTSGMGAITLTNPNHFFAGWYQTREVKKVDGAVVDELGRKLELKEDGTYILADLAEGEEEISITPAYIYSDYWDFETDTIDYAESNYENGVYSMKLYAGWVEYYEFNYWYQVNGEWTLMDETTSFDYKTTNADGSTTSDKDTIFLPQWENGAMKYTHSYANNSEYTFPKLNGKTFSKAYLDPECTQEITDSYEHTGTLDLETCTPSNRVQNIYVVYEDGERYQITSAQQLIDNPNLKGIYEIQADLDFTGLTWPTTFAYGTFLGKIYGKDGQTYKLDNISVKYNSESAKNGGIFGRLGAGAELKNLNFTNATFDLSYTGYRVRGRSYGLLAGIVDENAIIDAVSIGGTFKVGMISLMAGDYELNLYANGNIGTLTKGEVKLQVYGNKDGSKYEYTVIPNGTGEGKTTANVSTGEITLQFSTSSVLLEQEIYNIDLS